MLLILKKLPPILYFFYLYTLQGFILLCASLYFFIKVITQKLFEINSIAQEGNIGIDITGKTYDSTFYPFLLLILAFILLYFIFFNTEVIVFRYRFLQLIKEKSITVLGSKNIKIIFDNHPPKTFFLINATLVLTNITSGGRRVLHKDKPRSFLQNKEFNFDLSNLPTGKYRIDGVFYHFKDALGLFNAKAFSDKEKGREILIFNNSTTSIEKISQHLEEESDKFTDQIKSPTENFFNSREYRNGDEIKKIHWKNTAKTGKLVVRLPEDKPDDNEDLNLVLNLFTVCPKEIDQSFAISNFLNSFIFFVNEITYSSGRKVNLYINGKTKEIIKNLENINPEHLESTILKYAQIQGERNLTKFIKDIKIDNQIVFTLSSDLVLHSSKNSLYIYKLSKDFKRNKIISFKKFFRYTDENYFGVDIYELLRYYNPIHIISLWESLIRYKKVIKNNEQRYSKTENITYL